MGALQWARHLEACDMRLQHSGRVFQILRRVYEQRNLIIILKLIVMLCTLSVAIAKRQGLPLSDY